MATSGGRWRPAGIGAVVGLLSAAVALGTAELAAGIISPASSPVKAVGAGVVRLSPNAVTEFAKEHIGTGDKGYLQIGIYVLLAAYAALIGTVALRRRTVG
ncbi:MAG: hypothetical protein WCA46_30715, partial [Actinocatenispora sp.]